MSDADSSSPPSSSDYARSYTDDFVDFDKRMPNGGWNVHDTAKWVEMANNLKQRSPEDGPGFGEVDPAFYENKPPKHKREELSESDREKCRAITGQIRNVLKTYKALANMKIGPAREKAGKDENAEKEQKKGMEFKEKSEAEEKTQPRDGALGPGEATAPRGVRIKRPYQHQPFVYVGENGRRVIYDGTDELIDSQPTPEQEVWIRRYEKQKRSAARKNDLNGGQHDSKQDPEPDQDQKRESKGSQGGARYDKQMHGGEGRPSKVHQSHRSEGKSKDQEQAHEGQHKSKQDPEPGQDQKRASKGSRGGARHDKQMQGTEGKSSNVYQSHRSEGKSKDQQQAHGKQTRSSKDLEFPSHQGKSQHHQQSRGSEGRASKPPRSHGSGNSKHQQSNDRERKAAPSPKRVSPPGSQPDFFMSGGLGFTAPDHPAVDDELDTQAKKQREYLNGYDEPYETYCNSNWGGIPVRVGIWDWVQ